MGSNGPLDLYLWELIEKLYFNDELFSEDSEESCDYSLDDVDMDSDDSNDSDDSYDGYDCSDSSVDESDEDSDARNEIQLSNSNEKQSSPTTNCIDRKFDPLENIRGGKARDMEGMIEKIATRPAIAVRESLKRTFEMESTEFDKESAAMESNPVLRRSERILKRLRK